jgi:HTH-type transcriptional repressor of puuD
MDIHGRIIELREKSGMSQSELGRKAELSQNYINQIEKRKRQCPIDTLAKICQALNITLSEFFAEKIESHTTPENECIEIIKGGNVTPEELKKALELVKIVHSQG